MVSSFRDGHYTTVITNEEITVYRSFGGRAKIDGGYATTVPATSRANTIVDSALLPEWQNTAKYEEVIRIPKGTRLNIGKVAPQLSSDGTVYLKGGADQIVLPKNWSSDWIESARIVPRR